VLVTVTRRPTSMSGQFTLAGLVPVSKQLPSATLIAPTPSCLGIRTIGRRDDTRSTGLLGFAATWEPRLGCLAEAAFAGLVRGLVLPSNRPYPHGDGSQGERPRPWTLNALKPTAMEIAGTVHPANVRSGSAR
jgi:hypothetical protein